MANFQPYTDSIESHPLASGSHDQRPQTICIDLDRTLLQTDLLWESVLLLLKQQPWIFVYFPLWLLSGIAYVKQQVANRVILDPSTLSYRQDVLDYLIQQHADGRNLVLATGSDRRPAEAIAAHLGIFSEVLASDGVLNLVGSKKGALLAARFGHQEFDYIGDSAQDLSVWPLAKGAILVEPSVHVLRKAHRASRVIGVFPQRQKRLASLFKALRLYQWVKNLLLFLPLIAAHQLLDGDRMVHAFWGFLAFSFCASSLYVFNDLLDIQADRNHPNKKTRPFASGALSIPLGLCVFPTLLITSFMVAVTLLPPTFLSLLGLYVITTMVYSFVLKQVPVVDVFTLAGLYTLRIFAGGVAANVPVSAWLLAFSMFFFLSLAFAKRHSEIQFRKVGKHQGLERRGYLGGDKAALGTMGIISGYLSVLVFALYLNSQDVLTLYNNPQLLWMACPALLYWISRIWLLAYRGAFTDDPLVVALKDPQSFSVVSVIALVTICAI